MRNTILPFDELMKAVLEQLKSQKYMESTTPVQALKHCARAPTSPAHSTCLLLLLRKTKSGVCWHHGFSLYI
jgi:hypothetical protein